MSPFYKILACSIVSSTLLTTTPSQDVYPRRLEGKQIIQAKQRKHKNEHGQHSRVTIFTTDHVCPCMHLSLCIVSPLSSKPAFRVATCFICGLGPQPLGMGGGGMQCDDKDWWKAKNKPQVEIQFHPRWDYLE